MYDVRVIVHDGASEAAARARYHTGTDTGDHRFVDVARARVFLDAGIADLASAAPGDRLPSLEARLLATRARIDAAFPARLAP